MAGCSGKLSGMRRRRRVIDTQTSIRCLSPELERWRMAADQLDMPVAEWIRRALNRACNGQRVPKVAKVVKPQAVPTAPVSEPQVPTYRRGCAVHPDARLPLGSIRCWCGAPLGVGG